MTTPLLPCQNEAAARLRQLQVAGRAGFHLDEEEEEDDDDYDGDEDGGVDPDGPPPPMQPIMEEEEEVEEGALSSTERDSRSGSDDIGYEKHGSHTSGGTGGTGGVPYPQPSPSPRIVAQGGGAESGLGSRPAAPQHLIQVQPQQQLSPASPGGDFSQKLQQQQQQLQSPARPSLPADRALPRMSSPRTSSPPPTEWPQLALPPPMLPSAASQTLKSAPELPRASSLHTSAPELPRSESPDSMDDLDRSLMMLAAAGSKSFGRAPAVPGGSTNTSLAPPSRSRSAALDGAGGAGPGPLGEGVESVAEGEGEGRPADSTMVRTEGGSPEASCSASSILRSGSGSGSVPQEQLYRRSMGVGRSAAGVLWMERHQQSSGAGSQGSGTRSGSGSGTRSGSGSRAQRMVQLRLHSGGVRSSGSRALGEGVESPRVGIGRGIPVSGLRALGEGIDSPRVGIGSGVIGGDGSRGRPTPQRASDGVVSYSSSRPTPQRASDGDIPYSSNQPQRASDGAVPYSSNNHLAPAPPAGRPGVLQPPPPTGKEGGAGEPAPSWLSVSRRGSTDASLPSPSSRAAGGEFPARLPSFSSRGDGLPARLPSFSSRGGELPARLPSFSSRGGELPAWLAASRASTEGLPLPPALARQSSLMREAAGGGDGSSPRGGPVRGGASRPRRARGSAEVIPVGDDTQWGRQAQQQLLQQHAQLQQQGGSGGAATDGSADVSSRGRSQSLAVPPLTRGGRQSMDFIDMPSPAAAAPPRGRSQLHSSTEFAPHSPVPALAVGPSPVPPPVGRGMNRRMSVSMVSGRNDGPSSGGPLLPTAASLSLLAGGAMGQSEIALMHASHAQQLQV